MAHAVKGTHISGWPFRREDFIVIAVRPRNLTEINSCLVENVDIAMHAGAIGRPLPQCGPDQATTWPSDCLPVSQHTSSQSNDRLQS
jgi:hypothetical protein